MKYHCVICFKKFDQDINSGERKSDMNNPDPFTGEFCCDICNEEIVIPVRQSLMRRGLWGNGCKRLSFSRIR